MDRGQGVQSIAIGDSDSWNIDSIVIYHVIDPEPEQQSCVSVLKRHFEIYIFLAVYQLRTIGILFSYAL